MEINEIIEKLNLNMKHYIESYNDSSKLNINELKDSPLKNVLEGLISQLHANNSIQMCKELVESELFANAVKEGGYRSSNGINVCLYSYKKWSYPNDCQSFKGVFKRYY